MKDDEYGTQIVWSISQTYYIVWMYSMEVVIDMEYCLNSARAGVVVRKDKILGFILVASISNVYDIASNIVH